MTLGELNKEKEGLPDQIENILVVILENILNQRRLKCLR
jgi:hypothetical protein